MGTGPNNYYFIIGLDLANFQVHLPPGTLMLKSDLEQHPTLQKRLRIKYVWDDKWAIYNRIKHPEYGLIREEQYTKGNATQNSRV